MIYLNLVGGLGNQLFEYAFARTVQEKTGQAICISTYEITFYDKKREPNLKKYILSANVHFTEKKLPWYVHRRNYISKILRKFFEKEFYNFFQKRGAYIWYSEEGISIKDVYKNDIYIGGYWQSENYFKEIVKDLHKELVPIELSEANRKLLKQIQAEKSICLHIRRGDYVGTTYQVCDIQYYEKAIKRIRQYLDGTIFVFSDDIEWVKKSISISGKYYYVEEKNPDYVDLFIMSNCHSFIISNSTFSWWAQELGWQDGKIVIAPSKWHTTKECSNIYLKNWILIKV